MRRSSVGAPPTALKPRDPTIAWLIDAVFELQEASFVDTREEIEDAASSAYQPLAAALTSLASTFVASTWTPTFTNVTNIAASTPAASYYLRFGDQVICWGSGSIDPTAAAGTSSELGISLPVASNLGAAGDLAGTGASRTNDPGIITGDTGNDRARLLFNAQDTANVAWSFIFGYRII